MKRKKHPRILNTVQSRITATLASVLLLVLVVNLFVFRESSRMVQRINDVFASNAVITQLADTLESAQNSLYGYLSTKSSASLEDFYRYEQELRTRTDALNSRVVERLGAEPPRSAGAVAADPMAAIRKAMGLN